MNRKKIYAFIDSQNLNLAIRNDIIDEATGNIVYHGWTLDFNQFYIYLRDTLRVSRAFLFIGYDPKNQLLYTNLQKMGYIIIHKPILHQAGVKKGNCDAEMVLHAMIEYPSYDSAVIVTGDGDFHCLVEHLENTGKLETLFIPNKLRYSQLLKRFESKMKFVSKLKARLKR